jgi:preprotein translocase subunit SecD
MRKRLRWKLIAIFAVTVICVLGITGFPPSLGKLKQRIHLGLDLKGGTHLILQVVTDDAVNGETDQAIERVKQELRSREIAYSEVRKRDLKHIEVHELDSQKTGEARSMFDDLFKAWDRSSLPDVPNSYLLKLNADEEKDLRLSARRQAINTIRHRVDELGVAEPDIKEHGAAEDYQILVQLPGVDEPDRVREIIRSTALLELKIVEPEDGPFPSREAALSRFNAVVPEGKQLLPGVRRYNEPSPSGDEWYLVNKVASISGRDLRTATASTDEYERPAVSFNLTQQAADRFERITSENIGKRLAIVLDQKVQTVPVIQDSIRDMGQITGSFTHEQANDLALILRSGALPASMIYLEERSVGASLGADSIRHGLFASLVASAGVILFMVVYYRLPGINAVIALILNLIILLAAMAYIKATLTLPGIAGFALLVGMAVDSNVLIFERIREELASGKNVVASVNAGFSKAFVTIVDTHVATIVSVLFLFIFGTGPVKGFAVVLFWGLLANLFTAVFASKTFFQYALSRSARPQHFNMMQLLKDVNVNWIGGKAIFIGLSLVLFLASIFSLVMKGGPRYGIDFRGGTLVYIKFHSAPNLDQIRSSLKQKGMSDSTIQRFGPEQDHAVIISLDQRVTEAPGDLERGRITVLETLNRSFPPPSSESGKMDLNNVGKTALEAILGGDPQLLAVLPKDGSAQVRNAQGLAAAILEHRTQRGLIKSFEELSAIPGISPTMFDAIKEKFYLGEFSVLNTEVVGAKVGRDLQRQAISATLYALGGMLIYIAWRFKGTVYGVAAVIAVFIDVIITLGFFSFFDQEISLTVIAALLTLVGYSMNDKIVVFDRIRENLKLLRRESLAEIVNTSVNQIMVRTVITSGLSFFTALALYLFGGEVINGFAFAMVVGIVISTYSTIANASTLLVIWSNYRDKRKVLARAQT